MNTLNKSEKQLLKIFLKKNNITYCLLNNSSKELVTNLFEFKILLFTYRLSKRIKKFWKKICIRLDHIFSPNFKIFVYMQILIIVVIIMLWIFKK